MPPTPTPLPLPPALAPASPSSGSATPLPDGTLRGLSGGHAELLKSRAYRERLREANRWATLAGAPLERWMELARRLPPVDARQLEMRPSSTTVMDNAPPLHQAVIALQAAEVARLLDNGANPSEKVPRVESGPAPGAAGGRGSAGSAYAQRHAVDPLNAVLGLSDQVWRNGSNLYHTVQWQPHELDAQAVIVGMLLAAGAPVDEKTVMRAMDQPNPGLVGLLLSPWSEPSSFAPRHWPTLPCRLASGRVSPRLPVEVLQHLQNAGYNLNPEVPGATPLTEAISNGNGDLVLPLLSLGARLPQDTDLLHIAIRRHGQCRAMIDQLILHGASVHQGDNLDLGITPLHTAAANDAAPAIQALLAAGAQVNARDSLGRTPLYTAAERGNAGCVETLLAAGADHHLTAERGLSLPEVARARLNQPDTDGDDHRTVQILETLMLNEALTDAGVGPMDPALSARVRARSRL